jgi:30S ribosomal protein 3
VAQNLKLKVLWLKNSLGLGIDQVNMKHQFPLTQYYFWPKTDLDSKPWLRKKEKINILNLSADIMNYWRQRRNTESLEVVKNSFFEVDFIELQN